MARSDKRFRETYNALIDLCSTSAPGSALPSENALAERTGVSRTVIRSVLQRLEDVGIVTWEGRQKTVLRSATPEDRLSIKDESLKPADLEGAFLEWVLRFDVPAGTPLNIAQLAREFAVTPHILQEFLASLSRFGLVERGAKGGWLLLGFTADFAVELSEFRSVLELNAIQHVLGSHVDHEIWTELEALRRAHLELEANIDTNYHDFSRLDEQFHAAINSVVKNRFASEFQKVISLIFHYHYMWDKRDEKARNAAAIREHLAIIAALQSRDEDAALAAARRHLKTSMTTLLSSLRDHRLV
ncbi:GntR family transcriptional regulator [Kaistia dalseonensis]|uniref:DNA-binding GntR family transcriptional regulator n=1 Tax=Kaistia dalseonensis TaxID=410840 RepID=A0ABU0H637_9HYPH|nr:GntR family transcriptional regulator [Kaistia dalseonensis]MCX5494757.1 GntR family transcriptional regulator [Kaistia dalseonensis]MDQ0437338.1 DNA-binding GntR family transcriptional regulator [Kaistia dalseonensis]